jgi:CheY-like chemotaxis protein
MARLLLLDDEPLALEWMTAALENLGHEVRAYQDAASALAELDSWRPDLIVSDILMPEMDGLQFTRVVRSHGGPPVLFISIAMKQADAVLAGAAGYVQKPATAAEIRGAVQSVLGHLGRRALVLIVDDDAEARQLFADVLGSKFDVLEADDGFTALELLHRRQARRERPVDLVITDFRMPIVNGAELIRLLRAEAPFERVPVIVQTSDTAALASPVWLSLNVAYQIDKGQFISWLRDRIDARIDAKLPGTASTS